MGITDRYSRQTQLPGFGQQAQDKLGNSKVLIVGAGGLGVPALQYLVGMGIGTIGIVDGDTISLNNLHRQVLYSESEVGRSKADTAVEKLGKLNAEVKLKSFPFFLTPQNALSIIKEYDLVIDASDNFATRYLVNDACVILNKPFIYGAVQQYEGHVSVFNFLDGPTYRCLYPDMPAANEIPDCNTAGILGVVPGIIGTHQALQAVKVITGVGKSLSGYLQVFDFQGDEQLKIKLKLNPKNKQLTELQKSYDKPACGFTKALEAEELFKLYAAQSPFYLIDVREPKEFNEERLKGAHPFPLSALNSDIKKLPEDITLITICQIGGRSAKAAEIISKARPNATVFNVAGGMEAWLDVLGDQLVEYPKAQKA